MRVCARVRIPVCPEPTLIFSHKLLGRLRTGFLVGSPLRIAYVYLHWERDQSSEQVWRGHHTILILSSSTLHSHFLRRITDNTGTQVYDAVANMHPQFLVAIGAGMQAFASSTQQSDVVRIEMCRCFPV
jgi:hypothetical protein